MVAAEPRRGAVFCASALFDSVTISPTNLLPSFWKLWQPWQLVASLLVLGLARLS
jgi:hypothetical protein